MQKTVSTRMRVTTILTLSEEEVAAVLITHFKLEANSDVRFDISSGNVLREVRITTGITTIDGETVE